MIHLYTRENNTSHAKNRRDICGFIRTGAEKFTRKLSWQSTRIFIRLYWKYHIFARAFAKNTLRMAMEKIGIDLDAMLLIIGYRSNASPPQLAAKFCRKRRKMPVIRGHLNGFDAVYAAGFAPYGIYPGHNHAIQQHGSRGLG